MNEDALPFVDAHGVTADAIPALVWEAIDAVVAASFASARSARVARILGCEPSGPAGAAVRPGATFPGFAVVEYGRPGPHVLEGRHRFARYRLTFAVEPLGDDGRSRVTASTYAAFPGPHGRVYRALVIGTRGHVLAVRRVLAAVARRAGSPEAAARRAAFEDECLRRTRAQLAGDAVLGGELRGHRGVLRSLELVRTPGDAEIVAALTLADGTPVTERYSVWRHDRMPNLGDPHAAREAASMIALAITGL